MDLVDSQSNDPGLKSYLEKEVQDLLSHPVLKSGRDHVRREVLVLKATNACQGEVRQLHVCPTRDVTQGLETDSFAHFDHPLLQLDVLLEVAMCASSPEHLISERKFWILLLHNEETERTKTLS